MYSFGAHEANLRKESYLAKIRDSQRPSSSEAHKSTGAADSSLEDDGGGKLCVPKEHGNGGGGGGGRLYVAVGKDEEDGKSNLLWAARNLLADDNKLVLLHVHHPADRIRTGFRKVDASQLLDKELRAYRKSEKEEMNTLLQQYLDFCTTSLKTQAEAMVIDSNSPANGIVKIIEKNHITNLVMGTSSFSPKRKVPKSKVAAIVHLQAKPYCQIFYICKETLACSREATQLTSKIESLPSTCTSAESYQPEFPARSQSLSPGHPGFLGSTDQQALQRLSKPVSYTYPSPHSTADGVQNISGSRQRSIDMTETSFSPNFSKPRTVGASTALKILNSLNGSPEHVSIPSSKEHGHSMVETGVQHDFFEQLYQVCNEMECSKKEASESQQKAERDTFEASMTFKAHENAVRKGKKDLEDRLSRKKTALNKEHLRIRNKMHKVNEQRAELENKLLETNSHVEELQQLQRELESNKNHVSKQVEQMCQTNNNGVFPFGSTTSAIAITEFSYAEIKEATNNFHESKKIGEGGCGSVYKGFLRHTTVAIKILNRGGTTGDKEFNDEVEILCRMRHPNLVTLIGLCKEAKALVFEFLSKGSLEDCLQSEHKREALSWRMRIRIAADICTGLIFLHSNKPKGIAHGDLKPDNVLLDAGFVCKLADFGISRPLNVTNTTITPYHRTDQLKGTMGYMDPAYLASGELTAQYDVYSFGVVLMRLLTNKSPLGLPHVMEGTMRKGKLRDIIDTSAGEWPPECAQELARLALQCCRYERKERPDLAKEAWGVLQAMMNRQDEKCKPPSFFICPMTKEIMRDPHIAADGFTYEGDAIKHWFKMGNKMSPMAYVSFAHHELIPNNALRFAIQEWKRRQQS